MKKLNFRAIFIVMLIVVLALALVACDKEKEEDKGNSGTGGGVENVKTYFNTLWDLTSGIGGESVESNEDLAISLDLGIALGTVDSGGISVQNLNVGLGIDAILDRSSNESSANTAFKIKIYGTDNENWGTVYYFFNDPANVYIDFAGQNIRIPFNYESKDGKYTTETFSKSFYELLNKDIALLKDKSAVEAIEFFTKDLGADWTLNTLVGGVTKLFNLDLKELLYPTDPNASLNIGQMLEQYLQITENDLFDTAGNLDIKSVLTNEMVAQILFKNDKTKVTATSGHTEISMSLIGTVLKTMDIGALINESTIIELDYGISDNKIDGFDISLTFGSISAKVGTKAVMPKVTISVNDLSIGKASKSGIQMAANKDSYTNEVAIDASVALDLKGISISPDALLDSKEDAAPATEDSQETTQSGGDKIKERLSAYLEKNNIKDIALDGKLEIGAYGKVDLANRIDKGQTNTTALKAWLAYGDANIVEMSFVGNTIAVKVNQEANIGGVKVVDALISLFGDDAYGLLCQFLKETEGKAFAAQLFADETHLVVNPEFKGAVWTNINIAKNFNDLVNGLLDRFFGNSEPQPSDKTDGATSSAEATTGTVAKIASTIKAVLPYINTEDGLTIDVTSKTIGKVVAEIGGIWDSAMSKQENFINTIIDWDRSNILTTVVKILKLDGTSYANEKTHKDYKLNDKAVEKHISSELAYYTDVLVQREIHEYKDAVIATIVISPEELAKAKKDKQYEKMTDEEIDLELKKDKYDNMSDDERIAAIKKLDIVLKYIGKTEKEMKEILSTQTIEDVIIRFIGKSDDEIKENLMYSDLFLTELFKSNAKVNIDLGKDGISLDVDVDVNKDCGVELSIEFSASKLTAITDLGADVTESGNGWYYYEF